VYSHYLCSYFAVHKPVQQVNFTQASSVPTPFKRVLETKRSPKIEVYSYFFVKYRNTHAYSYFGCKILKGGLINLLGTLCVLLFDLSFYIIDILTPREVGLHCPAGRLGICSPLNSPNWVQHIFPARLIHSVSPPRSTSRCTNGAPRGPWTPAPSATRTRRTSRSASSAPSRSAAAFLTIGVVLRI